MQRSIYMSRTIPTTGQIALGPTDPARRRKAVIAAGIGTAIEYFDFTVYAFLATALAAVFFPSEDPVAGLLSTFAVFAVSFFLRPIGGMIIGHIADRRGRKLALTVAVVGMAAASFLIGLIPSFATIGIAAPILLVLMRSIQGLSAGGELASAASYVAEEANPKKRGFLTSFVNLGTVIGTLGGSLSVALLRLALTPEQVIDFGWRIPFLVSLPLGILALIIRRRMEESVAFEKIEEKGAVRRAPVWNVLRTHPRGVLNITFLNLASFAGYYLAFTYIGSYFETQKILSAGGAAWATTGTLILAGITLPFWGKLSDRFGRRPVLIGANIAFIVLAYPLFLMMSQGPTAAIIALAILGQIESLYMSVLLAAYSELFPVGVRVSGFALGYNFSSILAGGTAAYIATWLISVTGNPQSPAIFLIVAAALSLLFALFMKETANRPLPVE
jgi:MHS family proline/betaine transporter-like MFS transporter